MERIGLQFCRRLYSRTSPLFLASANCGHVVRPFQVDSACTNSHWIRNSSKSCGLSVHHHDTCSLQTTRLLSSDLAPEKHSTSEWKVDSQPNHLCDKPVTSADDLTCSGCGAILQGSDPALPGFVPQIKIDEWRAHVEDLVETNCPSNDATDDSIWAENQSSSVTDSKLPLVCQRCFSLKHYNTALNITLKADDYKHHLSQLKDKRALILLMVDVVDFPGSIFPDLHTLVSADSRVMIVANKIDLFPKTLKPSFWNMFKDLIVKSCMRSSLRGCTVTGVHFISAKTGAGVKKLAEEVVEKWGSRGDVYLLGCTNVGKSSLFNELLVLLCGAKPGQVNTDNRVSAPMATISLWPGTTLGLLSFPIMSVGKRRRLMRQMKRIETEPKKYLPETSFFEDEKLEFDNDENISPKEAKGLQDTEMGGILEEIGIGQKKNHPVDKNASPMNRFWLYDTPGAINDAQLVNHLTTRELKLAIPKKTVKPRTFILKPGQCMFIGGLARLDYELGPVSAYFTVFAASYLPIQVSKIIYAESVYCKNLGSHLLKIPTGDKSRLDQFPRLYSHPVSVCGVGWDKSAADVVLSSAGWVAVTIGQAREAVLRAHTPLGRGIHVRKPSLFPEEVNKRGRRSRTGNRSRFLG